MITKKSWVVLEFGKMNTKMKVGIFSFTGCEGCVVLFSEILNRYYQKWIQKIEFVHARILRQESSGEIKNMDIAIVEGAISSNAQEEKLKKIRAKSRVLVAFGSCATLGSPSNQRNFFTQENINEIKSILERFKYKEKVLKLADVVKVDEVIPGCPMNENVFLEILNRYLNSTPISIQHSTLSTQHSQ